jgi:hypothetical protein
MKVWREQWRRDNAVPTLSTEDAEGMICLLVEARLQTCLLNGTNLEEL